MVFWCLGLIGVGIFFAVMGLGGTVTLKTPYGFIIGGAAGAVLIFAGISLGILGFC